MATANYAPEIVSHNSAPSYQAAETASYAMATANYAPETASHNSLPSYQAAEAASYAMATANYAPEIVSHNSAPSYQAAEAASYAMVTANYAPKTTSFAPATAYCSTAAIMQAVEAASYALATANWCASPTVDMEMEDTGDMSGIESDSMADSPTLRNCLFITIAMPATSHPATASQHAFSTVDMEMEDMGDMSGIEFISMADSPTPSGRLLTTVPTPAASHPATTGQHASPTVDMEMEDTGYMSGIEFVSMADSPTLRSRQSTVVTPLAANQPVTMKRRASSMEDTADMSGYESEDL
ncbi:hypothetical protein GGI21_003795, partial [Coemansia aciculifera]